MHPPCPEGPAVFFLQPARVVSQSEMYLSRSLIFAILPFFTAAISQTQPPTCGGTAISIAKHERPYADPTLHASRVQTSIAYAIRDFPSYSTQVT
jgi:hypothetical protein